MHYSFKVLQCLQGSMELTDVISHPLMEVVLQLEYVVSWSGVALVPVGTPTRSTRRGSTVKVGSIVNIMVSLDSPLFFSSSPPSLFLSSLFPPLCSFLLSSHLLSLLSSYLALLHPLHHPHSWLGSVAAMHVRHSPRRRMPRLH